MAAPRRRNANRAGLCADRDLVAFMQAVGANLRRISTERELTVEAAATLCQMTPNNYSPIEHSKTNFTAITVLRIVRGLRIDASALFEGAWKRSVKRASAE